MIFNLRNTIGARRGIITENSFSFDGDYLFTADEDGNFELALLESGALEWYVDPGAVDLFLVGAGQDGGTAYFSGGGSGGYMYNDSYINSGKGGDGGRTMTNSGVTLGSSCTVVVGTSGADSSITSDGTTYTSANAPAPVSGGRGAEMRQRTNSSGNVNKAGSDGVLAYNADVDETMIPELSGVRFGASGGGGHANNNGYVDWNGVFHSDPVYTDTHGGNNTGGQTGAGKGGERDHKAGYDATGYGNGGGGGYGDGSNGSPQTTGVGGAGSDGIILIRNHKEANA
jgi:hypothetical protein